MTPNDHARLTVRHAAVPKDSYRYVFEILDGGRLVARFSHDHRGDDYWVEFPLGTTERAPLGGNSLTFLQGGGREPLRLTPEAVAYLTKNPR